jgi:hypothetical protein
VFAGGAEAGVCTAARSAGDGFQLLTPTNFGANHLVGGPGRFLVLPGPGGRAPDRGSPQGRCEEPAFPAALVPRKSRGPAGRHTGMDVRLGGALKPGHAPGTGTGTPSSGYPHRSLAPIPVRYASVDTATTRFTALQGDTFLDREETPRQRENSQPTERIRRVWQVLGSNQRRLSRRFYRSLPPSDRHAT